MSARSFRRPDARLFEISSARPINGTSRPRSVCTTRPDQTVAKSGTPLMDVNRSIRFGGNPNCITMSGCTKSACETPSAVSGAPKSASARHTRWAFSGDGSIKTSRSCVPRGTPWTASACAPTTTNRASASRSAKSISIQSSFIAGAGRARAWNPVSKAATRTQQAPTCGPRGRQPWRPFLPPSTTPIGRRLARDRGERLSPEGFSRLAAQPLDLPCLEYSETPDAARPATSGVSAARTNPVTSPVACRSSAA